MRTCGKCLIFLQIGVTIFIISFSTGKSASLLDCENENEVGTGDTHHVVDDVKLPCKTSAKHCKDGLFDGSADFQEESNDDPLKSLLHRERRGVTDRPSVGGLRDVLNSEREKVTNYSKFALEMMDTLDADSSKRILGNIISAHRQIVDGFLYHLNFEVSISNCDEGVSQVDCRRDENPQGQRYLCKVQVHRATRVGAALRLLKSECFPITEQRHGRRNRSSSPGGVVPASVDDPYIKNMAQFVIDHLTGLSSGEYKKKLIEITEAYKQIVSGNRIILKIKVGESSCRKDSPAEGDCSVQDDLPTQICDIEIWEKLWINQKIIKKAVCSDSNNRK